MEVSKRSLLLRCDLLFLLSVCLTSITALELWYESEFKCETENSQSDYVIINKQPFDIYCQYDVEHLDDLTSVKITKGADTVFDYSPLAGFPPTMLTEMKDRSKFNITEKWVEINVLKAIFPADKQNYQCNVIINGKPPDEKLLYISGVYEAPTKEELFNNLIIPEEEPECNLPFTVTAENYQNINCTLPKIIWNKEEKNQTCSDPKRNDNGGVKCTLNSNGDKLEGKIFVKIDQYGVVSEEKMAVDCTPHSDSITSSNLLWLIIIIGCILIAAAVAAIIACIKCCYPCLTKPKSFTSIVKMNLDRPTQVVFKQNGQFLETKWYKDGEEIPVKGMNENKPLIRNVEVQNEKNQTMLTIAAPSATDVDCAGDYKCVAQNKFIPALKKEQHFTVEVPNSEA